MDFVGGLLLKPLIVEFASIGIRICVNSKIFEIFLLNIAKSFRGSHSIMFVDSS